MIPRWVPRVTLALGLTAVAVSGYLTIAHYSRATVLACADTGVVNCAKVTQSEQATFAGIPVAVLGLGWSAAMSCLCLPVEWRSRRATVHALRLALAVAGAVFVLWLVYAELFLIHSICLWCTVVHGLALAMFALIVLFTGPALGASRARETADQRA